MHVTTHVSLSGTPGQPKKDPLWAAELLCICITSEEAKFLRQFYTGLAPSKGCGVGKWFGRLWQNQLWPHSGISKPWKTSLAAVTATLTETEKIELQSGSAKAQDSHFHAHPSLPAGTQLNASWALHRLLWWEQPATWIHPQSWEVLSWLWFTILFTGISRNLFGKKKKCLRDLFFSQI